MSPEALISGSSTFLPVATNMLTKRTRKNQVTLPKSFVEAVGPSDYYEVTLEDGRIVLTPVRIQRGDAVRRKLEALGITEDDVEAAIGWARTHR